MVARTDVSSGAASDFVTAVEEEAAILNGQLQCMCTLDVRLLAFGRGEQELRKVGLVNYRGLRVCPSRLSSVSYCSCSGSRRTSLFQYCKCQLLVHARCKQPTGFWATSLAIVAGVAYFSGRLPGWMNRFSLGIGRPDEISGLTRCHQLALAHRSGPLTDDGVT